MNSANILCLMEDSEEEVVQPPPQKVLRRIILQKAQNLMEMCDNQFKMNFRLNKTAFKYVLGQLNSEIPPSVRSGSVSLEGKLAACLRFFAEGACQRGAAQDFNVAMAQPRFSQHLSTILDVLERILCPKWITLAMTEEEKVEAKRYFYDRSGIPGVIMCVDGTHIKIFRPSENAHLFYNRKGFFSMNAMIICDHRQRIRYINARHPGASHDSHIWNASEGADYMKRNYLNGDKNTRLLGDAGYPLQPWLMTPFRSVESGTARSRFNTALAKARSEVERTIGVLKNRFRCLLGARQLHYKPEKVAQIVNVCCALHNICVHHNIVADDIPFSEEVGHNKDSSENGDIDSSSFAAEVNRIREEIMSRF